MIYTQVTYNSACPKCGIRFRNHDRPVGQFVHVERCKKHLDYETWSSIRHKTAKVDGRLGSRHSRVKGARKWPEQNTEQKAKTSTKPAALATSVDASQSAME